MDGLTRIVVAAVTLAGVFGATPCSAGQTPSTARALADAFADAWNRHDARAFGRLYADDADWVTAAGEAHRGRAAIEAVLGREHDTWARSTTLQASDVVVRELDQARAVVMFKWEIRSTADPAAAPSRGNTLLVAAKSPAGWRIVAGQVARVPASK